jgi:uncharacterized protein
MPRESQEHDNTDREAAVPRDDDPGSSGVAPTTGEVAGPVMRAQRIVAIDVLRGIALCGILVMNIRTFAHHWATYDNPHALGEVAGLDWWVWVAGYLFTDMKMMAIFSMLFGAGITLMAMRMEETDRRPAGIHYRRMLWLLVIGIVHAYLIWSGDVLVWYAICGAVIYLARRWRPWIEISLGAIVLSIGVALIIIPGHVKSAEDLAEMSTRLYPTTEKVDEYVAVYRGSWLEQMPHRASHAFGAQTGGGIFFGFWRAGGLMLIGMGLFKLGCFSAARSMRFYLGWLITGLAIGMPLVMYGLYRDIEADFAADAVRFTNGAFNYIGSVFVALAWVAIVMLMVKGGVLSGLSRALAAVGQMALTNYLMQSIICTLIFYGHGFGFFGTLGFAEQMLVVLGVWAAELIWSPLWLRQFRFGPFEWLWRSLTYWRLQPMRRTSTA